jgi:putative transposase
MPNAEISISEQCRTLNISRSLYYYEPVGETDENITIMRRIDELYTDNPAWGSRKMRDRLILEGNKVNRKRIQRLMRLMGIEAIYPKKNLSRSNPEHRIYPYLLRNMSIDCPNQVWCTDITYIRLQHGFVYLVAILDWYSRKVLSWELSTALDSHFCISALEKAMYHYGKPEIFNTDQGCQFTSDTFTEKLLSAGIRISMDGKGRASDNIIIERFWRSLKYEEVYLKEYESVIECRENVRVYMDKYNNFRPHASLDGLTPSMTYAA